MRRGKDGRLLFELGDAVWLPPRALPPAGGVAIIKSVSELMTDYGPEVILVFHRPYNFKGLPSRTVKEFQIPYGDGRNLDVRDPMAPEALDIALRMIGNRDLLKLSAPAPIRHRYVYPQMMAEGFWGWVKVLRDLSSRKRSFGRDKDLYDELAETMFWEVIGTDMRRRGEPVGVVVEDARRMVSEAVSERPKEGPRWKT